MLDGARQWVSSLDPQHKQRIALGAMLLVGGGLLYTYVSSGDNADEADKAEAREHSLSITDETLEGYNAEQLSSRIEDLQQRNKRLAEQIESLEAEEAEEESGQDSEEEAAQARERMASMQERMAELEERLEAQREAEEEAEADDAAPEGDAGAARRQPPVPQEPPAPQERSVIDEDRVWEREPVMARSAESGPDGGEGGSGEPSAASVGETRIYSGSEDGAEEEDEGESKDEELEFAHLTAGSILSGELMSGLDVPTGQASRSDPMPVLVRVHKNAILPNHYRAEVRDCFIVGAAYGDLSSERAYIRGNTISCVMEGEEREVVEQPIALYATGEDGKAGVRGNLVTKQGQVLTRAMMAGFAEGIAEAFNVQQVPSLNLNGGSQVQTQDTFSQGALRGGAATGVSSAMDRLAQFYIDMAEGMYPVIEVDAGREVDLIVTQGTTLEPGKGGGGMPVQTGGAPGAQ